MTALDGVALVEGENGGNHWCAEEEEEEEQKDPQRGLLSGARQKRPGKHTGTCNKTRQGPCGMELDVRHGFPAAHPAPWRR